MRVDLLVNNFTYIAVNEKFLKLYEPILEEIIFIYSML